jgi:hypothetical protein
MLHGQQCTGACCNGFVHLLSWSQQQLANRMMVGASAHVVHPFGMLICGGRDAAALLVMLHRLLHSQGVRFV